MADRGHHLLLVVDILDEGKGHLLDAQEVGVDLAAWQNDRVVITG
jgi:hypothetical protein